MSFQPTIERIPTAVRPSLRLLRGGRREADHSGAAPERPSTQRGSRILVAGADAERRATVLRNLSEALPDETQFGEAEAAWEVLEQAPSSGVVMLAGDLDEATAESVMHVLGHRYPSLPVVALGACGDGWWDAAGPGAALARR
ncbi:MAG TPA: hypothetical protein VMU32_04590 [Solirubrobacteraceae bacterium]|nr:hypothetical protein [Solirubrobacteraceae bacterium]